jgi:transcriptional regulator with XRE-family HTH domain
MPEVKHYFMSRVKHCSIGRRRALAHNQEMLDAATLAARLRGAMDARQMTSAELARACEVSPQVVYAWRKTGRIHKKHLQVIARHLEQPLAYFLDNQLTAANGSATGALRYALYAAFPQLDENDVSAIIGYASELALGRRG